jgi:glycosyltransferase involved in cell wall biosynthesis
MRPSPTPLTAERRVSVVIPARDEASRIAETVRRAFDQDVEGVEIEVIVVDDGSTDETFEIAREAGAHVIQVEAALAGRPGSARNRGAELAQGDPIIFLDADCTPVTEWMRRILAAHDRGADVVGGSLAIRPDLPASARCDYYCGSYLVHPGRPSGWVRHHPPPNISVRRAAFEATQRFSEGPPYTMVNEERIWQGELLRAGGKIFFEPQAVAYHENRPGLLNLVRRSYRWGYSSIACKAETGATRFPWLFRYPIVAVIGSIPMALAHSEYALFHWVRAGVFEPLWMAPGILLAHLSYGIGATAGGIRWLRARKRGAVDDLYPGWW